MIHSNFKRINKRYNRIKLARGGSVNYSPIDTSNIDTDFGWNNVIEGGISGAAAGTTLGPIGTAVGAVVGAGAGAITSAFQQKKAREELADANYYNDGIKLNNDQYRLGDYNQSISTPYSYYNKGGKISTKQVGAGIQVKGKKGKDTIPMFINGKQVMLDNNEIIVNDANGNPVVLSDDLGTADKYRNRLSRGANPKVEALKLAEEAKKLNPNPNGKGRAWGGYSNNNGFLGYDYNKRFSINTPTLHKPVEFFNYNNPGGYDYFANSPVTKPNIKRLPHFGSSWLNQFRAAPTNEQLIEDLKSDPTLPPDTSNFKAQHIPISSTAEHNNNNNFDKYAQAISFLGTTANNIIGAARLANTKYPKLTGLPYIPLNTRVNKPIFDSNRIDINRGSRNATSAVLNNTTNSNVALSRLNNIEANRLANLSRVGAQEQSDIGRLENANTQGINRTNMFNTQMANQYNNNKYRDTIGRINTDLALTNSTLAGLDKIIENAKMGNYQIKQLQALSNQYGLGLDMNSNSVQDFVNAINAKLGRNLKIVTGQ